MTEREANILKLIEQHRYLSTRMIASALFRFPSGKDKAWQVLRQMAKRDLLSRFRIGRGEYVYHLGRRSAKWRHWLDLARFHFALEAELKSWQRIEFWQTEVKYPFGIADGFYIVKTTLDNRVKFFLEADDGNNAFDKVTKYRAYHASRTWRQEWWGESFPLVLIVTPRAEQIRMMARDSMFRVIEGPEGIMQALKGGEQVDSMREDYAAQGFHAGSCFGP